MTVAVASDEAGRSGKPDVWKRQRLIGAGAHVVVPDFAEAERLLSFLYEVTPHAKSTIRPFRCSHGTAGGTPA
jgi:hypothetical protein